MSGTCSKAASAAIDALRSELTSQKTLVEQLKDQVETVKTQLAEVSNVVLGKTLTEDTSRRNGKGLQLPKLTKYIKGILEQYPDDGQILKELLQNADDAGASTVRFLLDESTYKADAGSLVHPELHQFQGPALLVYNDAVFTEADWNGICLMQESIKRDDVIKTGRFGLGFKSIFHITDLPVIMSGNYIGVIDPHQVYLPDKLSAYNWHLTNHHQFLQTKTQQFEPIFLKLFGAHLDILRNGECYDHTVFRFPLRNKPSPLSGTCYSSEKILKLFRSLELDQGKSLLFLKSIQCIEVYVKSDIASEPKMVCSMRVAANTAEHVSQKRQGFLEQVLQQEHISRPVETTLEMTIEMDRLSDKGKSVSRQDWLVYHTCHGQKEVLHVAQELKVPPWVGIALPLSPSGAGDAPLSEPDGQLFATLPLPLDGTETTGLAFHIHAYFAVEQNRRHLRWPTPEEDRHKLNSFPLMWNQLLVNECIPQAVTAFFKQSLQLVEDGTAISPEILYKLMPDEDLVDANWKPVVSQVYKELFASPCLYSHSLGGKWVKPAECILSDDQHLPSLNILLEQILIGAGLPVVNPPGHIRKALNSYNCAKLTAVSPGIIHTALLKALQGGDFTITREDALLLLQYFLENGQPKDLLGLPLIPLLSGEMATFRKSNEVDPVFMASKNHPASLLPTLEHQFVETKLEPHLESRLLKVAHTGITQIRQLNFKQVLQNIPSVLPKSWSGCDIVSWLPEDDPSHPSTTWMEQIWDYIHHNNPKMKDWPLLEKLHLLPLDGGERLCRFDVGERIILKEKGQSVLPTGVCSFLSEVGVIVLSECPRYVWRNKELVHHFVHSPSCEGVIDAVMIISQHLDTVFTERVRSVCSDKGTDRKAFVSYLSDSGINMLSKKKRKFLRGVPLFSTVCDSGFRASSWVSLEEVKVSGPAVSLPVPFPVQVIDVKDKKVQYLLESLEVKKYHQVSFSQVLTDVILPAVKLKKYSEEQLDALVCYIMDHHQNIILNTQDTAAQISGLRFVETGAGERRTPCDVYDPKHPLLATFLDETMYPHKKYHKKSRIACLEKLGMKSVTGIPPKLFLCIAHSMQSRPEKAGEFIKLVTILSEQVPNENWWEKLRGIAFLSTVKEKPDGYPKSMPWKGSENELFQPSDVCHVKLARQIGSTVPVVDLDESVLKVLMAKNAPSVQEVTLQLKLIIENYNVKEKSRYLLLLDEVYGSFARFTKKEIKNALGQFSIMSWIWSGNGFQTPGRIVLKQMTRDLSPYVYSLPPEMDNHRELFHKCGVQETVQLGKVLKAIATKHEKNDQNNAADVAHDLQLSVSILTILCQEGVENPLVPTETGSPTRLRLMPAADCTALDGLSKADDLFLVHRSVPLEIVDYLRIPTVTHRLLDGEEFDMDVESFGQTEPLTSRLKSILEGYTDGLSVLKEMVQNADDAGATEVKLVYDMRENKKHRHSLIDPAMAAWQGPAIWIYNDAVFTQQDFKNIIKLNGATKREKEDAIGSFGLGFNAVYNLTDVPSILSHDTLVYFDPHTTYLGKAVRDKTKPGLKINIARNQGKLLSQYPDQFAPWKGVCGCNLTKISQNSDFNGTLFRLPLRGRKESYFSDISDLVYDEANVEELLKMIYSKGSDMLLFTQSVIKVSVSIIPKHANAAEMKDLFEMKKEPVRFLREHGVKCDLSPTSMQKDMYTQKFINECSILKASVKSKCSDQGNGCIESSMVIATVVETFKEGEIFMGDLMTTSKKETHWVVSQCIQDNSVSQEIDITQPPVAGIAIALEKGEECYSLKDIAAPGNAMSASYFSFLPLPVKCPLPFHINGTFVLDQSRRHFVQKTDHDKTSVGGEWNKCLMEGAVCTAYMTALTDIISLTSDDEDITKILPWNKEDDLITLLSVAFWRKITSQQESPQIFCSPQGRVNLHHACFLDRSLHQIDQELQNEITGLISSVLLTRKMRLVHLPARHEATLANIHPVMIASQTITAEIFILNYFLPNMTKLKPKHRDSILIKALKMQSKAVDKALKSQACIPVTPNGKELVNPQRLIHPRSYVAALYGREDSRFPCFPGIGTEDRQAAYEKLEELGMVTDNLQWIDILERARYLTKVGPRSNIPTVNLILEYLRWKIAKEKGVIPQHIRTMLQNEKFLPAVGKPNDWSISWKGDAWSYCGLELHKINEPLLASTQLVLLPKDVSISHDVARVLGIKMEDSGHPVQVETLKMQVREIACNSESLKSTSVQKSLHKICQYLDKQCEEDVKAEKVRQTFSGEKFIAVQGNLVRPDTCAFKLDFDGHPYMNKIPSSKYPTLMKVVGVREEFSCIDYIKAIATVKHDYGDMPVLPRVKNMIAGLCQLLKESKRRLGDVECETPLFLPDTIGVLQLADTLCYNDSPWLKIDFRYPLAHAFVGEYATLLGVVEVRTRALAEMRHSIPCDQNTKYIEEIQSNLKEYPLGNQVFYDILRMAEDAGSEEVHFVLDSRTYWEHPVFSNGRSAMQGPSLCVYTNASFKQEDLNALFLKRSGLQSVYHLTDTPAVLATLTDGTKSLSVYDPNAAFVLGTSADNPGVMYQDVGFLKKLFPGVFKAYHEGHLGQGTLFRFPFRTAEAATLSTISKHCSRYWELDNMLKVFMTEAYEALLFMTSLRKIVVTRFSPITSKYESQEISATVPEASSSTVDEFRKHVQNERQRCLEDGAKALKTNFKQISYQLSLTGLGKAEEWNVVQQCGLTEENVFDADYDTDVVIGYISKRKDMNKSFMGEVLEVPIGGVAALKSKDGKGQLHAIPKRFHRLLPQPHRFPVHINGNFALSSKENLALSVADDLVDEWNMYISKVVAATYLTLLMKTKQDVINCSKDSVEVAVSAYFDVFPGSDENLDQIEMEIIQELYDTITMEAIIPESSSDQPDMEWKKADDVQFIEEKNLGPGRSKLMDDAFYKDVMYSDALKGAKLCGFPVARCPAGVMKMIEKYSDCNIAFFSPEVLREFLLECDTDTTRLAEILRHDSEKQINPESGINLVRVMLGFCKQDEDFEDELDGLPLLVTSDGELGVFYEDAPVYKSPLMLDIHPTSKEFLHPVFIDFFTEVESPVFKDLDIKGFCEGLEKSLPSEMCENEPVPWEELLEQVSRERLISIWKAISEIKDVDEKFLKKVAGDLCLLPTKENGIVYLYPLSKAHIVFEKTSRQHLQSQLPPIEDHFPVSDLTEIQLLNDMLASWKRPKSMVHGLHHYKDDDASIFSQYALFTYFNSQLRKFTDEEMELIKELPMFETLSSKYVSLVGQCAYVIPDAVPMQDMDSWKNPSSGILFLKQKATCKDLYVQTGCKYYDEAELYVEYIFPQLDMLTNAGRLVHMDYVFNNLQGNEVVMKALGELECVKNKAGTYCQPCELYDPDVHLFKLMQANDLPADGFTRPDTLKVLREAGMKSTASKEMLVRYAEELAKTTMILSFKVYSILDYIKTKVPIDLQPEYMKSLSDIPFIPRRESPLKSLCPELTDKTYVTLKDSVVKEHGKLVWSVAPLISTTALRGLSDEALEAAGVIKEPSIELVAQNIKRVCENSSSENTTSVDNRRDLSNAIDACYIYISQKMEEEGQTVNALQTILSGSCCIPVEQAQRFVKPCQTVVEAQPGEEVRPYLYRLPDNLVYSKDLLVQLGVSERPSIQTYQKVLSTIYKKVGLKPMTDKVDIDAARHATYRVFRKVQQDAALDTHNTLWLMSSENCLWTSSDLIYNNNFAMKDRLKAGSKILIDLNIRDSAESIINCFPEAHRPKLLTSVVKEVVAHARNPGEATQNKLGIHLSAAPTVQSIRRLAHHILVRRTPHSSSEEIQEKLSEVQSIIQNTSVRVVSKLKTCLTNDTSDVVGNWEEKTVFGDRTSSVFYIEQQALDSDSNQVYTYKVLADLISGLCGDLFREYIGVLMVILSEDVDRLNKRLDEMAISREMLATPDTGNRLSASLLRRY